MPDNINEFGVNSSKWMNSASQTVFGMDVNGSTKMVPKDSAGATFFSKTNPANVWIYDGPNCDSFMRLRVSDPVTLFDAIQEYNDQPLFWQTVASGGATATHTPNESTTTLSVSADNSWVIRQTYRYFRYQPGKSQMPLLTGVMGERQTNIVRRIGYFDDRNGIYFEQTATDFKVVRRTYTSGGVENNAISQDDWSEDKLDGTGASGITLDEENSQIFFMDFEWLGVGGVRIGFVIDNKLIYCHHFKHANVLDKVYMTTPNLPLRYELRASGAITATATMKQICSTVISEGGQEDEIGLSHSVGNGTAMISATTRRPVLSIRAKSAINSITNRSTILPQHMDMIAVGASAYYELVINGTLTSATFSVDPGSNCAFEADTNADAITGGEVVESGYIVAGNKGDTAITDVVTRGLFLYRDYSATGFNTFSVVVTSMTSTATVVAAALKAKEIY